MVIFGMSLIISVSNVTGCHIPPLGDQELIALLRATNDNDVDNGLSSWIGRCCKRKRVPKQATPEVGIINRTLRDMTLVQGIERPPFAYLFLYLLWRRSRNDPPLYLLLPKPVRAPTLFARLGRVHCPIRSISLVGLIKQYVQAARQHLQHRVPVIDFPPLILVLMSPQRVRGLRQLYRN